MKIQNDALQYGWRKVQLNSTHATLWQGGGVWGGGMGGGGGNDLDGIALWKVDYD